MAFGGHLAHHVGDLVDGLDLGVFYAPYEGDGRRKPPYEPLMMVKALIYGYAAGVFSSRGIARKLEEDVAFRVLAAGNFPSHRTICEFRRRHLDDFRRLFVEVVRLAAELGAVRFGALSIDGTKVRANAQSHLKNQILPWFRGRPIAGITPREMRRWFSTLHATPAAANRSLPVLSRIMRQAEISGHQHTPANGADW